MPSAIYNLRFDSDKILPALSLSNKDLFLSYAKKLHFKRKSLIFYEGGVPTGIFLIQKGKVKIYKTGIYGKDQIFYIYKENDLFGYHALLADERYEDASEALEDCEILFIDKNDFSYLLNKIEPLKQLFIKNMSHEFGALVNIITTLAQKTIRERLALHLLILHDRYWNEETQKAEINLPREDLANIIGTARESLGRLLKDFKEDHIIHIDKRKIEILDFNKIKGIAAV